MEDKKAPHARLDRQRSHAFLLGLIISLSAVVVCLELTFRSGAPEEDLALMDELAQDMEAAPAVDPRDLLLPQPRQQEEQHESLERIEVSKDVSSEPSEQPEEIVTVTEGGEKDIEQEDIDKPIDIDAPPPVDLANDGEPVLRVVEEYPEFPGGMMNFIKWLTDNLRYPATARSKNIQGKVITSFVVNKDGSVSDAKVLQGVEASLDREALRVLQSMPRWKSGKDRGVPFRTLIRLPIVFKI